MDWGIVQVLFWVFAGVVAFYFSLGNARAWTSIAVGFSLVLFGEVLPQKLAFLPGADIPRVEAMGYIIGTIAILVLTHGFQEYYVFSRTLELEGNKLLVYLATLGVIAGSFGFLLVNPVPSEENLRTIRLVGLTNWVFLSLINLDMIRKIYLNIKDSPISRGFIAFGTVFFCLFLWKGSDLYIQVYDLAQHAGQYPFRYNFSLLVGNLANILSSVAVGGTFLYLARRLR